MKAQTRLRNGEIIEIDGIALQMDGDGIVEPGDIYVAERNTGPQVLIAQRIDQELGCIFPTLATEYPYDIGECVRVKLAGWDAQ